MSERGAETMERLWGLFVAGSLAVFFTTVLLSPGIFPRWDEATQIVGGLGLGTALSAILYAVMQTISAAPQISFRIVRVADWPKLRWAIFAGGIYAGVALTTFGFQSYIRSSQCLGYRGCAVSLTKGAVWSAIWPVYWPVYLAGLRVER
jgi:hypothetical protein